MLDAKSDYSKFGKNERRQRIIELISHNEIETQDELAGLLRRDGFMITQATISRDMKEMRFIKVPGEGGKQKYAIIKSEASEPEEKYFRMLRDNLLDVDTAQNLLVMKTISGMAMGVAAAIDALKYQRIIGCIAGDDTIMAATKSNEDARIVKKMLADFILETDV